MKKVAYFILPLALSACGTVEIPDVSEEDVPAIDAEYSKKFTFAIKGDFANPQFVEGDGEDGGTMRVGVVYEPTDEWGDSNRMSRANQYMTADGNEMTDLWVIDYKDGEIKQSLHQVASDEDWGAPSMSLMLGTHHIYFLASRGTGAIYDAGKVTWSRMNDTFYKDYEVTVVKTSNGNRAVTLDRVATRMSLVIEDAIPAGTTAVVITPETWYNGWNMLTGAPVSAEGYVSRYDLPSSWWGSTNSMLNMWGLSSADEWQTNISIVSKAGETANASAVIEDAPFKANRVTKYSGRLYSNAENSSVSLNATWLTQYEGVY